MALQMLRFDEVHLTAAVSLMSYNIITNGTRCCPFSDTVLIDIGFRPEV
jgi:hypothetical protein